MTRLIRHAIPVTLVLLLLLAALPVPAARAANCDVTTTADGLSPVPAGSLRERLSDPNCSGITFNMTAMGGGTITLAGTLPTITRALTLTGPGAGSLTVQGNNTFQLLSLNAPGLTVAISGLTLSKGHVPAGRGGNLSAVGGTVTLTDMALIGATTATLGSGAGAAFVGSVATLTRVVVSGNAADNGGGGLYQANGSLTLVESTVRDNTVGNGGGGIYSEEGSGLTLIRSTISGNRATSANATGGGILLFRGVLTATNSTIADNTATTDGGGVWALPSIDGTTSLSFVTITGNTAGASGGGLYFASPGAHTTINLRRSIVAGNQAGAATKDCVTTDSTYAPILSGGYNLIGNGTGCPNNGTTDLVMPGTIGTVLNPQLADNGGPTPTHALVDGSTAVDRIPTGQCDLLVDQRNITRAQGYGCDIGAFEARTFTLTVAANGPGTASSAGGTFLEATVVPISAVPALGAAFTGWTVDGSPAGTANPLSVTMNAAHAVVANFAAVASPSPSPSPSASPSPSPSASPSPAPGGVVALTLSTAGLPGGSIGQSPAGGGGGPFTYAAGTVVTLTATSPAGGLFTGWTLDGTLVSWAPTITLTMNANHAVVATFAAFPAFGDVPAGTPYADPVAQLAARGIIKGCDQEATPPLLCPDEPTLRAQMAALIVRAMPGWAAETWPNGFTDPIADAELWGRVATLQHYGVAQGYQADVCQGQGKGVPCFGPLDPVTYGQTLLFISRAMVIRGYWTLQPDDPALFPELNGPSAREIADHRAIVTYIHYAGAPPDVNAAPNTPFQVTGVAQGGWGDASSRGWFARALWLALDGYFGTDVVP